MKEAGALALEGSFFITHSLASVNRYLACALADEGLDLTIMPYGGPNEGEVFPESSRLQSMISGGGVVDLTIRHSFPPNLSRCPGRLVIMQPWEFARAPERWVRALRSLRAELWVNSNFTRNAFLQSGLHPDQVVCLPLGYDPGVFFPDGETEAEEFRFLFLGGTIERKGFDLLLRAYLDEFGRDESVRLVVKDTGTAHVYRHSNLGAETMRLADDPRLPKITYRSDDLDPNSLAELIRWCHCLVQPYRGEGFCLPVLEGMACGLPVIVTHGGPTDDFVPHGTGWKIASTCLRIPQLGGLESSDEQGWLEPSIDDLRRAMREAFLDRSRCRVMGLAAAESVRSWTWEKVAKQYVYRIEQIMGERPSARRPPARISLCMIAHNQERAIDASLSSAREFCDEMIVVDTGSTDRTREVAISHGARVIEFTWTHSYADARNESLLHATGEWVFIMDANEGLPLQSAARIREAVDSARPDILAFVLPTLAHDEGRSWIVRGDDIRLFRKLEGAHFQFRVYEQVSRSLRLELGAVARLDAPVVHMNPESSVDGSVTRRKHEHHLLSLDLREHRNDAFISFSVGRTRHLEGAHEKAVKWLRRSIESAEQGDPHVRQSYVLLVASLRVLDRPNDALETAREGLARLGGDPELHYHEASLLRDAGDLMAASAALLSVLSADKVEHHHYVDLDALYNKVQHELGELHYRAGQYQEAKVYWLTALQTSPGSLLSAFALFDAALTVMDYSTATLAIAHVKGQQGTSENWARMLEKYAFALGGTPNVAITLESAVRGNPEALGPRLVFARFLLAEGQQDEAQRHLKILGEHDVPEAVFTLGILECRAGRLHEALVHFKRALALNPGHEETQNQIARLRSMLGHESE